LRRGAGASPPSILTAAGGIIDSLSQAVTAELDAVGVVDDAIKDGVGESGIANDVVPLLDRNL
jgi:hypothetical protein